MKSILRFILLGALWVPLLVACTDSGGTSSTGGGSSAPDTGGDPVATADPGGGVGGTGGGGSVSVLTQGVITGFGSVFVNGVEFETNDNIYVADNQATEADLRLGMVVKVDGEINKDGLTGIANEIHYDAEVTGPIADDPVADADGETKSFHVLGLTVIVEALGTVFDEGGPDFTFDNIAKDDIVEASGFINGDGALVATYIEKKGAVDPGNPTPAEVQLNGTVSGFNGTDTFTLGTVTVTFDSTGVDTELVDFPAEGLSDGLEVDVKGTLVNPDEVTATRIKVKQDEVVPTEPPDPDGPIEPVETVSLQGFVTGFVSLGEFTVAGQVVDATDAVFAPPSLADAIQDGSKVEVQGPVSDGVLVADLVKNKRENVQVEATVSAVDPVAGTVTLSVVEGEPGIAFVVDAQTLLLDQVVPPSNPFGLNKVEIGDFLSVLALRDDDGTLGAVRIFRKNLNDLVVKGKVTAADAVAKTVTLLGITIPVAGDAVFQDENDGMITGDAFFAQVQPEDTVKIRLNQPDDGLADEVEFELPY